MAVSTTQSIWRSGGGDTTRTAYCGSGMMVAQFYVPAGATANTVVQVSATNTSPLVLPANANILNMYIYGQANAGEVLSMYAETATGSQFDLLTNVDAEANITEITPASTENAGYIGSPIAALSTVYGGGATALSTYISGYIVYFVEDPLVGQQNV